MASTPYCCLTTPNSDSVSLSAVGQCRIIADKSKSQAYANVLEHALEVQQATVPPQTGTTSSSIDEEAVRKAAKKKATKASQAAAKQYLRVECALDVSIIDVHVVVPAADLIATDGHVATALLDAGAERIVVTAVPPNDDTSSEKEWILAMAAMHLPLNRVMVHFTYLPDDPSVWAQVATFCDAVSLDFTSSSSSLVDHDNQHRGLTLALPALMEAVKALPQSLAIHCQVPATLPAAQVAQICKIRSPETGKLVRAFLQDPTAEQLGLAYAACCRTDRPDGLFSTVVCTRQGEALGLVYSAAESIVAALDVGRGVYYSRSRGGLWRKGDTSGHFQVLHRIDVDCDADALRFVVTQKGEPHPAFCHLKCLTCWSSQNSLRGLRHLQDTISDRIQNAPEGSYTKKLLDSPELLRNKLVEEAQELAEAESKTHVAEELADVLYFALTRAVQAGVSLDDAVCELDRRTRKVTRRPGLAKDFRIAAGKAILDQKKEAS
jgi:phosphoribosyl-ATP pyrophosphohydrolase/phosphoribosyl-AMP cyclohydrolase/histidinol dehydrogenase